MEDVIHVGVGHWGQKGIETTKRKGSDYECLDCVVLLAQESKEGFGAVI